MRYVQTWGRNRFYETAGIRAWVQCLTCSTVDAKQTRGGLAGFLPWPVHVDIPAASTVQLAGEQVGGVLGGEVAQHFPAETDMLDSSRVP